MNYKINSDAQKYNSIELKKRIKKYSKKVKKNKPSLPLFEPTGVINNANRGF